MEESDCSNRMMFLQCEAPGHEIAFSWSSHSSNNSLWFMVPKTSYNELVTGAYF